MGVLSVSLDKWYKVHGVQGAEKVITFGSINTRPPPKKFEEIKIQNESVGIKFRLPIRNNLETAIECCRTNYHSFLSTFAILSYKSMGYLINLLPEYLAIKVIDGIVNDMQMVFSNIPFSSEPWYLCNREVSKLGAFSNVYYNLKVFFVAMTYKEELRLTCSANAQLKMDPQLLLDYALDFIEEDIRKVEEGSGHLKTE
ncbi:unnamed protein product [Moneuplotes crassus]|uniref:O-acyltransferase WSD1 C-terminal domain-containing protein n=1 Tax=Euplotes crassus TaxID=5936 RepID=A0AAD1UCI4_EUPCR|nr:unnamed protein product [Moneuplotes crassus]